MAHCEDEDDYLFEIIEYKEESSIDKDPLSEKSIEDDENVQTAEEAQAITYTKDENTEEETRPEDVPDCWSLAHCQTYMRTHKWLMIKNGRMGCKFCRRIKDWKTIEEFHKGIRTPHINWLTCQVPNNGRTVGTRQSSIRRKVHDHKRSKAHIYATEIVESNMRNNIKKQLTQLKAQLDVRTIESLFEMLYKAVKTKQPINRLCREFIFPKTESLTREMIYFDILQHIALGLRKIVIADLLTNNRKITIQVYDHITQKSNKITTLTLHIRVNDEENIEHGEVLFFDLIEPSFATPEGTTASILNYLRKNNITMNYLQANLIGFIFEEHSALVGRFTNVGSSLKKIFPKAEQRYDSTYERKKMTTTLFLEISLRNGKQHFPISVLADMMFIFLVGPDNDDFDSKEFVQSWLTIPNEESSETHTNTHSISITEKKISNDMALAAEAYDEERLVIDLKADNNSQESDNDEQTQPRYNPIDTVESDKVGSVKRRKRPWRPANKLSELDQDAIEKIVQRVREASDLYAINEDNDRLFLLSLLPFMKQLDPRENLEFRMEVQKLLHKKQHLVVKATKTNL